MMSRLKRVLLLVARVVLLLCVVQGSYVLFRTAQVVGQSLHWWPFGDPAPCPEGIGDAKMLVGLLARQEMPGRPQYLRPCLDEAAETDDADGDGLLAEEEFLRMTSDQHADTDEDGVLDPLDYSPNGHSRTYRERLESAVLSSHLREWSGKAGTVYCVTGFDTCLDVQTEDVLVVIISHSTLSYLVYFTDVFPDQPCRDNGFITMEPFVFVPGGFYIYDLEYAFGGRCGGEMLKFFVDLPFLGPVHIGDKWLWIS